MRDAGFKARKKKTDVRITCHGFTSYPYLSQALALRMSLMSFFTLSHQESKPNIAMLISQKKKLRLRETKSCTWSAVEPGDRPRSLMVRAWAPYRQPSYL